jgi:hypothetical protein
MADPESIESGNNPSMFRDRIFTMRNLPASLLLASTIMTAAAAPSPVVGGNAPDFSLSSVSGKAVRLSEL